MGSVEALLNYEPSEKQFQKLARIKFASMTSLHN